MKKLLYMTLLAGGLTIQAQEINFNNGVYLGIESGFLSFGGDSLNMETIKTKSSTNKVTYKDVSSFPTSLKVGYQHYRGNRVELYGKYTDIDTDGGNISTKTYGVNYEFGFSSLSSGSQLLPYILIGMGGGEASSSKLKRIDGADVTEFNLGFGIHYQVNQNIYATFGYRNNTMILADYKDNTNNDIEFSDTSNNILNIGVSYHF